MPLHSHSHLASHHLPDPPMSKGKGPDVLELVDSSDEEPPAPPRAAPLPKDDGTIDLTGLSSSESSDSGDDRPSKHQPVATSVPAVSRAPQDASATAQRGSPPGSSPH